MFAKVIIVSCLVTLAFGQFEVPNGTVEVFYPKGLKVSIPDQDGIKLFALHAKVNEEMNGREAGTFSRDILKAKEGRWTFNEPTAQLKIGDTLYFWTYVDYFDGTNKLGYPRDDQEFRVTQLLDKKTGLPIANSDTVAPPPVPTSSQPTPPPAVTEEVTLPSGCKASVTVSNRAKQCQGKEIFSEKFSKFRPNVWAPEVRFAGSPDFEFVIYENRPEVLSVQNGKLKIRPVLTEDLHGKGFVTTSQGLDFDTNCTGIEGTSECAQKPEAFLILPPATSAQISTKNKWSFKYGKVEIRAKLPKGDWIYPELYLTPKNEEYGPGYESGQIRIAFLAGNDDLSKTLSGGCILGPSTAARHYAMKKIKKQSNSWTDSFHNFTLFWRPNQITVGVDGTVFGNIYLPEGGFASEEYNLNLKNADRLRNGGIFAPFDQEMYLTVGVGVGGHCFEDSNDGKKPWKNNDPKGQKNFYKAQSKWKETWKGSSALEVDSIQVWAL